MLVVFFCCLLFLVYSRFSNLHGAIITPLRTYIAIVTLNMKSLYHS